MSPRITFQHDARLEFFEAIAWYEKERAGLGREFAREVVQAVKFASTQPDIFRRVRGGARKIRLKRFRAYSIYFAMASNALTVLAVFHGSRNPQHLTRRLE
jgi:plasmid stabilization system protein ParE